MNEPLSNSRVSRAPLRCISVLCAALVCASPGTAGAGLAAQTEANTATPVANDEARLLEVFDDIAGHRIDHALKTLEQLLEENPTFRLARLVYADLLLAKSRPLARFGNVGVPALEKEILALREEARARIRRHREARAQSLVPSSLVKFAATQQRAIVVDVSGARLYLFANVNGEPRLVADYYVSTGKNGALKRREGDQKTPVGVYFTTGRISQDKLPDFYGAGAFPVNYPNEWDQRLGRTGYGIWLHGVPSDTYNRSPRASDGCMALANGDLSALSRVIDAWETPVVISDGIEWVSASEVRRRRETLLATIDQWRRDWQSLDHARYARHYARAFHSDTSDYRAWMRHKRRVNAAKRFIRLELSNISILEYPGEPGMVVVNFDQNYKSSNLSNRIRKRQYWKHRADGAWEIVYEGTIRRRREHMRGIPYSARSEMARFSP